ncbi:MAG: orotate phosphoribosyltransferase [Halobacteriovoraceae bacterium]|nr:orotate phosphoribosyltransferase [Halobacteriovoraceae bacterium]
MAQLLIESKALRFSLKKPFHYASGLSGPLYCDNRILLSLVKQRKIIVRAFTRKIQSIKESFDLVAGVATGGIPYGMLVAHALNMPFLYIRKKNKQHGMAKRIEGMWKKGDRIILIEDLVNQGGSILDMALHAREQGLEVVACFCIVDYQMKKSRENLKKHDFPLYSLSDFTSIVNQARTLELITENERQEIVSWQQLQ